MTKKQDTRPKVAFTRVGTAQVRDKALLAALEHLAGKKGGEVWNMEGCRLGPDTFLLRKGGQCDFRLFAHVDGAFFASVIISRFDPAIETLRKSAVWTVWGENPAVIEHRKRLEASRKAAQEAEKKAEEERKQRAAEFRKLQEQEHRRRREAEYAQYVS